MRETQTNIMPEISVLSLQDVGGWIAKHLSFIPDLGLTHGDHLPNTGGAPMLDQLVFDYPDKQPDAEL